MSIKAMQPRKTLRSDARTLVATCAGWKRRLAARRITQFLDREVSDCGLTYRSARVDGEDRFATDDTLSALARRSGLEQSTLSARPVQEIDHDRARSAAARGMADRGPCATARGGDPNLSQGTG
jgi:hypothetical protein